MGVMHALDRFTMQACKIDQHRYDCRWPPKHVPFMQPSAARNFAGRGDPEESEGAGLVRTAQ